MSDSRNGYQSNAINNMSRSQRARMKTLSFIHPKRIRPRLSLDALVIGCECSTFRSEGDLDACKQRHSLAAHAS